MNCFKLRTLFRGTIVCILILNGLAVAQEANSTSENSSNAPLMQRGKNIYQNQCASCHGASGEGVSGNYPEALVGDSTVGELTQIIHDTMPEGEPHLCIGDDAAAVAAFIHQSFYSPEAQHRRNPRKPSFARLTGNQLRQSLADLYAKQDGIVDVPTQRGVKGLYFDGDRYKNENKKMDRIDKTIDFNFERESPGEGIKAESFYIYWEGSLLVERTGRYEIVVRSTCSFKMDFGKIDRLFIDNHVQSGDKTEFRESVYLTAGRAYPFKIDFIQRKRKTELPPANVSLSWVPPGGVEQIIPERNLMPSAGRGTFSLQSFVPPDDRSYGFDRGVAINKQWDESTTAAALEFSTLAAKELYPRWLKKHKEETNENRSQLKAFLKDLLQTAFRSPLDSELATVYVDRQVDKTEDDAEAIRRVLLMGLKSPRFLYPLADADKSPSQRAA
nr:PA14 domain-containing protein [Pirellula sp.]